HFCSPDFKRWTKLEASSIQHPSEVLLSTFRYSYAPKNIPYPQVPGGFACPHVAYGGCQPRVFANKHPVWRHLDNVYREVLDEKKSNLGNKVIILYRWTSIIPGVEELPAL